MFESESVRLLDPELQWHCETPAQGESIKGWISGPLMLVTCHFQNNASRPCRDKITKGGMLCYCAKEPVSSRQKGYLPIRTPDGRKIVVLMAATTAKKALIFQHGTPVEFWRPRKNNTPLSCKQLLDAELGEMATKNHRRHSPDDIRRYLLEVLWQDRPLVEFFQKAPRIGAHLVATEPPAPSRKKAVGADVPAPENVIQLAQLTEGIG